MNLLLLQPYTKQQIANKTTFIGQIFAFLLNTNFFYIIQRCQYDTFVFANPCVQVHFYGYSTRVEIQIQKGFKIFNIENRGKK